jgi:hypothetical protein
MMNDPIGEPLDDETAGFPILDDDSRRLCGSIRESEWVGYTAARSRQREETLKRTHG